MPMIAHMTLMKKKKVSMTNRYCMAKKLSALTIWLPTLKEFSQNRILRRDA
jgi:hypothetical protein